MFPNVFQLLNFERSSVFFHPSLLSVESSIHCQDAWVTATTHQIEFITPPPRQHTHSHMAALLRDSLHNTMKGIYTKCDLLYVDSLTENPLGHLSSFRGSSTFLTLTFLTRFCQFLLFSESGSFKQAVRSFL